jgi:phosphinothricin acetyltransferase
MKIKIAESNDVAGILDIYAPFIENTHTSFEYQVPSHDEMQKRIQCTLQFYPWIVAERNDKIIGYAYASRFRYRKAYDWVCETSVYVHPVAKRRGVATQLYNVLLAILKVQGIRQCIAGIALPNNISILFHEKHEYKYVGVFPKVGYKKDRWVDVAFWQLEIMGTLPNAAPIPWHKLSEITLIECGLDRNTNLDIMEE